MRVDDLIRATPPVTLDEMLAAREDRAERQRRMRAAHPGLPLVSFSLNIPGERKAYPLARDAFRLGCALLDRQLARAGLAARSRDLKEAHTGCELIAAVGGGGGGADAGTVKKIVVAIEESHPLGRLFDFDVLDPDGVQLHREAHGGSVRACIVCGGSLWECARSRAHSAEELARRAAWMLYDHFSRAFADRVAARAARALLHEVSVTPKPGLVDRSNNGSHADMDMFTFIDGSAALTPFFRDMVLAGMEGGAAPERLLPRLRCSGQWAEDAMFAATGGVNTHKGLIFSLGILCAAIGVAGAGGVGFSAQALLDLCGRIAVGVEGELSRAGGTSSSATHGERAFAAFGMTGVRGEAARGFPAVRDIGYPTLAKLLAAGVHVNDAGVVALLRLLACVDDTSIVARSDHATLCAVRERVAAALEQCGDDIERLLSFSRSLDAEFIAANLSAGGCADLLALSFMLVFMESPEENLCCSLSRPCLQ